MSSSVGATTPSQGYAPRPLLPAVVGPLASHVIAREFGAEIEELASRYERAGDVQTSRQLRLALGQMQESARLRNERQRETGVCGDYGMPKTGDGAASECPPPGTWMDAPRVATRLGVRVRTVTGWCKNGELVATRGTGRGKPWLIDPADVAEYLERRQADE